MKNIKLKSISIQNFKGLKTVDVAFKLDRTVISGQNASGKTSIFDAYTWLLFDKDSLGNSKFEIRELTQDGQKVHHTDIRVEAVILIDGTEYTLAKVQKEKWVKKRGQEEQEYSGNANEYAINGYPKSQKEFSAFVSEVINEKTFQILSNPLTFSHMDWKDQRKILFDMVGDMEESEIEADTEYFDLIKPELAVASLDDIRKKYTKAKSELKKKPDEIQTRIDELSLRMADDSEKNALAEQKESINREIGALDAKLMEVIHKNDEIDSKIKDLAAKQALLASDIISKAAASEHECEKKIADSWIKICDLDSSIKSSKAALRFGDERIADLKEELERTESELHAIEEMPLPEGDNICPTCGQPYPEKMQKDILKKNKAERDSRLQTLTEKQADIKNRIEQNTAKVAEIKANIEESARKLEDLRALHQQQKEELAKMQANREKAGDNAEYRALAKEIAELNSSRSGEEVVRQRQHKIMEAILEKKTALTAIETQLRAISENSVITDRIEALKNELKVTAAKVSKCDQVLYALESYTKALAKRINDKFDGLDFKLFEEQINGGIKETCEITLDGVPFSDLNSGHKIVIGLKIIEALAAHYGITAPVWVDNAESINAFNIPDIDAQMILLSVSDEKALTVA